MVLFLPPSVIEIPTSHLIPLACNTSSVRWTISSLCYSSSLVSTLLFLNLKKATSLRGIGMLLITRYLLQLTIYKQPNYCFVWFCCSVWCCVGGSGCCCVGSFGSWKKGNPPKLLLPLLPPLLPRA